MANLKISQLPDAGTLQDSDLVPVVQTSGAELVTAKTTVASFRSAASSSAALLYPGTTQKAVFATGSDLYTYDRNGKTISRLNPSKFTFEHDNVDIEVHTEKPNKYKSDLVLDEMGLRFTRIERKNGAVVRASQIRMNSADGYFNANENVEIAAGTLGNEPDDVTLNNLDGGTLRLMAGSKMALLCGGAINIEPSKNLILKTPENLETQAKNISIETTGQINISNNNSGTLIKTTSGGYENTLSVKKDGIKLITQTNGNITNQLSFSNSAATLKSTKITLETDYFTIKDSNGNLLYDNSTIAALLNTVASLQSQINALNARVTALENA